jgi:hypothetical protein
LTFSAKQQYRTLAPESSYTVTMRILVHAFEPRDGWILQCLADDARTTVAPQSHVANYEMVLRLLRYVGASEEGITRMERDLRRWSIGSVRIDLIPGRKNLLRVRPPWNDGLAPR